MLKIGATLGLAVSCAVVGFCIAPLTGVWTPKTVSLSPALDAFERVAAEEHYMAVAMRINITYERYDKQGLERPNATKHINEDERRDWREYLLNLRAACDQLGLTITESAIQDALDSLSDAHADENLFAARSAYHQVSAAFKSELAQKVAIIRSK